MVNMSSVINHPKDKSGLSHAKDSGQKRGHSEPPHSLKITLN